MKRTKLILSSIFLAAVFSLTSCHFTIKKSTTPGEPEPELFLLTYLPNGAEGDLIEDEILSGEAFTVSENIYTPPADMKFAYWNTRRDGRGNSYEEGDTLTMPRHDVYLFAHWIENDSFSIIYRNCEDADNTENPGEFNKASDIALVAPVKTGYIFDGWYTTEDFSDEGISGWAAGEKNKSITLYAKWTPETRTVTYNAGAGSGEDIAMDVDYDQFITLEESEYTPPRLKKFLCWTVNGRRYIPGDQIGPITEDVIIQAEFAYFVPGDVTSRNITINGKVVEKTDEICVVSPAGNYTVVGSSDYAVCDANDYNGAFVEGRTVSLSPFAISRYMVTRDLFASVFGGLPSGNISSNKGEFSEYTPVSNVTWYAAVVFCNKLTLLSGGTEADLVYDIPELNIDWKEIKLSEIPTSRNSSWEKITCNLSKPGYRLLTEAEWEFAARGGDTSKEDFGYTFPGFDISKPITCSMQDCTLEEAQSEGYDKIPSKTTTLKIYGLVNDDGTKEYAWLQNNSSNQPHQVGLLKPNALGIYDMSGNLWEWIWDYYQDSPVDSDGLYLDESGIAVNPMGPATGTYRIRKGCNYQNTLGLTSKAATGYRGDRMEANRYGETFGFRIGRTLVE